MSLAEKKKIQTMKSSLPQFWEHFNSLHEQIEKNVTLRDGSYQGLPKEALYTSDDDLEALFSDPLIEGTFIDLGCGTGKTCLLYGHKFPERKAIGLEFESARLSVGQRYLKEFPLQNVSLIHGDLVKCEIPVGDTYFVYFPTGHVLDRILFELYRRMKPFILAAIESHGDLLPRLELVNWLELKSTIPLSSARHHPVAHVYKRIFVPKLESLIPFDLSFCRSFLLIEDAGQLWIGESFGLEWTCEDRFELKVPPRTIYWHQVKRVCDLDSFSSSQKMAIHIRSLGELNIHTRSGQYQGFIRKIIISPTFTVEISSGEKVEWGQILSIHQGSQLCYESSLV